jgi:hypothetical protein
MVLLIAICNSHAYNRYVPTGPGMQYPTIQAAISGSIAGDIIYVQPGIYHESITFKNVDVTVTSTNPSDPAVVQSTIIIGNTNRSTITFASGLTTKTLFTGFTIRGGSGNGVYGAYLAGGGIFCSNASPRIVGNIIESNQLPMNLTNMSTLAGGIFVMSGAPVISRNIIRDNQANLGGAICSLGGAVRIQDNFIYRNTSGTAGGAYLGDAGTFINNTLLENSPENIYLQSSALVANNIIAHINPGTGVVIGGSLPSGGLKWNDIWETNGIEVVQYLSTETNSGYFPVSFAGTNGNISADPLFIDLTNFDLRLSAPSTCINAGDMEGLRSTNELDVLGSNRVFALRVDLGAQEFSGSKNFAPLANAGLDQLVHWDGSNVVWLDGSRSVDPNSDPIQYHWSQTQGPPVTLIPSNSQASFTPITLGQYAFSLVVNDGVQDSLPDEVLVSLTNLPPVASSGFGRSLPAVPESIALDGSHSFDPEGSALSYEWRQTQGPIAELLNADQAKAIFKPAGDGVYEFELVVSDKLSFSAPSRCLFYLGVVPPVANAGLTRYAGRGNVTLDGSASFAPNTNTPLTYAWRQLSGPTAVFLSNTNVAKPVLHAFTQTTNVQEAVFELTVTAGEVSSAPSTVKVVVVPGWGNNAISQINGTFNTNKPTVFAFSGGNCDTGWGMTFPSTWYSTANLFTLSYSSDTNNPGGARRYFGYGDQIMAILSEVAPGYNKPIQTMGWSTGNMPATDVATRLNVFYRDPRFRVNRISYFDAACRDYTADIALLNSNREPGVPFWIDNYYSEAGVFRSGTLNVQFPVPPANHGTPNDWYFPSWSIGSVYRATSFNGGVYAGAFFSVVGPGKNYQLETAGSQTYFGWTNGADASPASYPVNSLLRMNPTNYPARMPGVVELMGPVSGTLIPPGQFLLGCYPVTNAVKYQLLMGPDPQHVQFVAWEGPVPPTNAPAEIPYGNTWWTIRAANAYGTTSWADPRQIVRDVDFDGLSDEAELLTYHTDPSNPDTDGDGHSDWQEVMAATNPLLPNPGFTLSSQPQGANGLRFGWYSDVSNMYALEFSTNLDIWETVQTFGPPARLIQFTNANLTNASGFYRVRSYPGN